MTKPLRARSALAALTGLWGFLLIGDRGGGARDRRGGGADLTKIHPAGIRTKSGGVPSIEGGKGPAGSGLSLDVAGVEDGGRKDATFLFPILL